MPKTAEQEKARQEKAMKKRDNGMLLTKSEFCLASGVSYVKATEYFNNPDFPAHDGRVLWDDFVRWRKHQIKERKLSSPRHSDDYMRDAQAHLSGLQVALPPGVARMLGQA